MTQSGTTAWPRVTYEDRHWATSFQRGEVSSRQWLEMQKPYSAAVMPKIADRDIELSPQRQTDAEEASVLLSRFDAEVGEALLPFASILLRSESASSSQIENLSSSARAVAESELGKRDEGNAAKIVRNVRAMSAALALADDLSNETIIAMQSALLADSDPEKTGAYRTEQVWIGGNSVSPHRADYIAPHHENLSDAMDDLLAFTARTDIPTIAHVAVAHAQFESIHPFLDGNGRTGRALAQALLRHRGVTTNVAVPVSAGLLHNVQGYFDALTAYREGDIDPIVWVFAEAAGTAVRNGNILFSDMRQIRAEYEAKLGGMRSDSTARKIANLIFEHPVVNAELVQSHLNLADQSAYRAFDALVKRGVLMLGKSKKRNRIWVATDITDALDRFAARAGRRSMPRR